MNPQEEKWITEFDEKFPAMDYYLDGGVRKDILAFIHKTREEAKEEMRSEIVDSLTNCLMKEIKESLEKEIWNLAIQACVEHIEDGVRNYKVPKELKHNTLNADYIFVYDLNTFVLKSLLSLKK